MIERKQKDPISISREQAERTTLNFEALRQLGLEWSQQLSGNTWTDYNLHDPGVTILENLCFGLLDLAYRSEFKIEDILFAPQQQSLSAGDRSSDAIAEDQAFHFPEHIFTTNPVTVSDYRKLILDRFREVRNVWINPIEISEFGLELTGLYKVFLQLDRPTISPQLEDKLQDENSDLQKSADEPKKEQLEDTLREVNIFLENHRNLCERFHSITIPEQVGVSVNVKLIIAFTAETALLKAEIFFKLHRFLRVDIPRYNLKELREAGFSSGEIFDGPPMRDGFIKTDELKKLSFTLIASEVKELILSVDGVIEVPEFDILINGVRQAEETITFDEDQLPYLDIDASHITVFTSSAGLAGAKRSARTGNGLEQEMMRHHFNLMLARDEKAYYPKPENTKLTAAPPFTRKELKQYHSIQRLFPQIYGIGEHGTGPYAGRKEVASAKQLKAYLLIFEQVMADYLAQLAHLPDLFSLSSNQSATYFSQRLINEHIPGLEELFLIPSPSRFDEPESQLSDFHEAAAQLWEREWSGNFHDRRHQFLDHLLARFGESFPTELLEKLERSIGELPNQDAREELHQKMIKTKISLLKEYSRISQQKGAAGRYPDRNKYIPLKLSGAIEKWHQMLLIDPVNGPLNDVEEAGGMFWVEHLLLYPRQPEKYAIRLQDEDGNTLLESETSGLLSGQQQLAPQIIFYGTREDEDRKPIYLETATRVIDDKEEHYVKLRIPGEDQTQHVLHTPIGDGFDSEQEAVEGKGKSDPASRRSLKHIFKYLQSVREAELENMNSLFDLVPQKNRDALLPEHAGSFFNQRMSLILPAWGKRFSHKEYQEYAQKIAYQCFPAHIIVDLYWIDDPSDMERFEEVYFEWIGLYEAFPNSEEELIRLDTSAKALVDIVVEFNKKNSAL